MVVFLLVVLLVGGVVNVSVCGIWWLLVFISVSVSVVLGVVSCVVISSWLFLGSCEVVII